MVSTVILLITGLSLLFHDIWIGRWLLWLEGGITGRGLIHRWAAAALMGVCGYHFLYILFTERVTPSSCPCGPAGRMSGISSRWSA
jgi:hypothetical protein